MGLYHRALLPLLHRLDPETAHASTLSVLSLLQRTPLCTRLLAAAYSRQDSRLGFTWKGLAFRNPVGLAAGVDKNGRALRSFHAIGMGFLEVGTVTPRPQPGNPRPRMWRLPKERAMVNCLGFPSEGADRVARRLAKTRPRGVPLAVNIGKSAATPLERAAEDYAACMERLHAVADLFVVNVSSPNTQGLTSLQARPALAALIDALAGARRELARRHGSSPRSLLVKLSADLSDRELDDAAEVCLERGADGIVAVNTSTDPALRPHPGLSGSPAALAGGLSGRPLFPRALHAVARLRPRVPDDFLIVGVGGVSGPEEAWALIEAGANAVELYTGLVYEGPALVGRINRGLAARLEAAGLSNIAQAVGRARR